MNHGTASCACRHGSDLAVEKSSDKFVIFMKGTELRAFRVLANQDKL